MSEPEDPWSGVLLGPTLESVDAGVSRGPVPVPHTNQADYFVDTLGRQWVRKSLLHMGWQEMLAEAIGWFLGRALRAPVPHAAITTASEGGLAWLSAFIPSAVHWEPHHAHFVKNLESFGAMLTLDAIIHNHDRHRRNILLTPAVEEPDLEAWAIDMGGALVGYPSDFAEAGLGVPEKPNIARGLPVGLMADGAYKAAKRATELAGTVVLEHAVSESCRLVGERESNVLFEALSERMRQASKLVERYLDVVGAIT